MPDQTIRVNIDNAKYIISNKSKIFLINNSFGSVDIISNVDTAILLYTYFLSYTK